MGASVCPCRVPGLVPTLEAGQRSDLTGHPEREKRHGSHHHEHHTDREIQRLEVVGDLPHVGVEEDERGDQQQQRKPAGHELHDRAQLVHRLHEPESHGRKQAVRRDDVRDPKHDQVEADDGDRLAPPMTVEPPRHERWDEHEHGEFRNGNRIGQPKGWSTAHDVHEHERSDDHAEPAHEYAELFPAFVPITERGKQFHEHHEQQERPRAGPDVFACGIVGHRVRQTAMHEPPVGGVADLAVAALHRGKYHTVDVKALAIRWAAAETVVPQRSPGFRVSRSTGPDTLTAAMIAPSPSRTAADTDATPASRSSMLSTQPAEVCSPLSTRPAEPRPNGNSTPSGTIHCRPCGDCNETTHRRWSPSTTKSCTLSPVASRNALRAGIDSAPSGNREVATLPSAARSSPRSKRPSGSRRNKPCVTNAAASRWAVARGNPVAACSSLRLFGPVAIDRNTRTLLSSTPTPVTMSIPQERYLRK